jgi:hypothetical protein
MERYSLDPPLRRRVQEMLDFWNEHNTSTQVRAAYPPALARDLPSDDWMNQPGIAHLSARYPGFVGVEIMAYHNLGRDKAAHIGYHNPLADLSSADATTKQRWLDTLHTLGCTRARLG